MMEDFEDNEPSGIDVDISDYLEDKFNFPGTDDPVKETQPASGFDGWLNDRFRK
jgi:hypothetical protein